MSGDGLKLNLNLSPALTKSIEDELADHIACAEEVQTDSSPAPDTSKAANPAGAIRERLARPSILRRLASPHIVDQVSHTLTRKPTRAEWREFAWLLFWFALVYASDLIAVSRSFTASYRDASGWVYVPFNNEARIPENYDLLAITVVAWLLSAVARAGFFVQFGLTFAHAYRSGFGVMVARLIQLKLLHTILVTLAFAFLPSGGGSDWELYQLWEWKPGAVVNAWTVLAVFAASIAVLIIIDKYLRTTKMRSERNAKAFLKAAIALGLIAVTCLFLYQGAPVRVYNMTFDFISTRQNADPDKVFTRQLTYTSHPPLTCLGKYDPSPVWRTRNKVILTETVEKTWWSMPYTKAGAGLGWLAFPIPLMGFLSLIAMWWILGRRSIWDAILYGIIVFYAFWGTIGPFVFGSNIALAPIDEFMVGSPLPCFDGIFQAMFLPERYNSLADFWRVLFGETFPIIFAFFFSALIPWLMVGLFARTKPKRDTRDFAAE